MACKIHCRTKVDLFENDGLDETAGKACVGVFQFCSLFSVRLVGSCLADFESSNAFERVRQGARRQGKPRLTHNGQSQRGVENSALS